MNEIERQDAVRRRLLWATLVAGGIWQSGELLVRLFAQATFAPALRGIVAIATAAAGLVWGFYLLKLVRWQKQVAKAAEIAGALDDEYTRHARLRSFAVGFWAMLAVQAILLFAPLPAELAARSTILVGVAASGFAFLRCTRAEA